jgi:hypothetical protein
MADAPDMQGVQADIAGKIILSFEVAAGVGVGAVDRAGSTL